MGFWCCFLGWERVVVFLGFCLSFFVVSNWDIFNNYGNVGFIFNFRRAWDYYGKIGNWKKKMENW